MKDKLRELAERWSNRDYSETDHLQGYAQGIRQASNELLAILDAEGDGGAVEGLQQVFAIPERYDWADESDHGRFGDAQKFLAGFGLVIAVTTDTYPARSGVVSDEDVDRVIASVSHVNTDGMDGDSWDRILVRAAIQGERHER